MKKCKRCGSDKTEYVDNVLVCSDCLTQLTKWLTVVAKTMKVNPSFDEYIKMLHEIEVTESN